MSALTPERGLIFRIIHVDNLEWILEHGLHCRNSELQDPNFITIGNPELIDLRQTREIPFPPGGTLNDYVPFYFTPYSPMLLNIKTGYNGVRQRPNSEIAILVSSLSVLRRNDCRYVCADRHAYLELANFFDDDQSLKSLPWTDWQRRNFKRDPDDPERFERYQAETLVYRRMPTRALLGITVYTSSIKNNVERLLQERDIEAKVIAQPRWYF